MKERPILMNAPMVRALLDGTKMQTRRLCKEMNAWVDQDCREVRTVDGWPYHFLVGASIPVGKLHCPYGKPGDQLWVRETFQPLFADGREHGADAPDWETGEGYAIHYPATDQVVEWIDGDDNITSRCKPSIHMPRWASRILLEIVSVRVERLQAITLADICKEGLAKSIYDFRPATDGFQAWAELWESINGADSWDANPWVWVVEFKRVTS